MTTKKSGESLNIHEGARTIDDLNIVIDRVKTAQEVFATYTQEQVDKIFAAMALAANDARIPLAKMAVEETGMGVVEDKVIKNHFAAEEIYNKYRDAKTCGVIERDATNGFTKLAEPLGIFDRRTCVVKGTRTHDHQEFLRLPVEDVADFLPGLHDLDHRVERKRQFRPDRAGAGEHAFGHKLEEQQPAETSRHAHARIHAGDCSRVGFRAVFSVEKGTRRI